VRSANHSVSTLHRQRVIEALHTGAASRVVTKQLVMINQ
jgi:hypothetical protein